MIAEIVRQRDRLNALFLQVDKIDDLEMQSHWAKYLCVLVSGFIETSARSLLISYASQNSTPKVASYVSQQLKGLQNVNLEKLLQLFCSFSDDWRVKLETYTDDEMKNAVNNIIANRNNIAHGQHVGLTYTRVNEWYRKSLDLIQYIDEDVLK